MGPEPSVWEWLGFALTVVLVIYAFTVAILDRLPEWIGDGLRDLLLHRVPRLLVELLRLLSWAVAWFGAGIVWALSAGRVPVVDEMLGRTTARGSVNTYRAPAPAYVTSAAAEPPPDPPQTPASVCLSADQPPPQPAMPPAFQRLMVDRSRETVLDVLTVAGWDLSEMRAVLKANNNTFAVEVEAARARVAPGSAPKPAPSPASEAPSVVASPVPSR